MSSIPLTSMHRVTVLGVLTHTHCYCTWCTHTHTLLLHTHTVTVLGVLTHTHCYYTHTHTLLLYLVYLHTHTHTHTHAHPSPFSPHTPSHLHMCPHLISSCIPTIIIICISLSFPALGQLCMEMVWMTHLRGHYQRRIWFGREREVHRKWLLTVLWYIFSFWVNVLFSKIVMSHPQSLLMRYNIPSISTVVRSIVCPFAL